MAASNLFQEKLNDMTECPICTETLTNPKMLPCIHTFCLKCLNQYKKENQPGDEVPCPVCRTEFTIPVGGYSNLPTNFFIGKLLDAQKSFKTQHTCEVCLSLLNELGDAFTEINLATMYCVECEENMCEQCSRNHKGMKISKSHQILPIGTLPKITKSMCEQHPKEEIKMYCLECKAVGCLMCFMQNHQSHKCSDVNTIAEELKKEIKGEIDGINQLISSVDNDFNYLEKNLDKLNENTKKADAQILKSGEDMKLIVDISVQRLRRQLNENKSKKIIEIDYVKEELQRQKLSLESFKRYSQEIVDKAVPSDVARIADNLKTRAKKLKKSNTFDINIEVDINFVPSNIIKPQTDKGENIVGRISNDSAISPLKILISPKRSVASDKNPKRNIAYDGEPNDVAPEKEPKRKKDFALASTSVNEPRFIRTVLFDTNVRGVTVLKKEMFIILEQSSTILVYNADTFNYQTKIFVADMSEPFDIVAYKNAVYVCEFKNQFIYKVTISDKRAMRWSTPELPQCLSITAQGHVLLACYSPGRLIEYALNGVLVREILLQNDVIKVRHALRMDSDQFLVCSGGPLHRLCLVDKKGRVVRDYSGHQIYSTKYMVAGRNGFNLISDSSGISKKVNNRILMVNSKLEFVKEFFNELDMPDKICFSEDQSKLYVADWEKKTIAIFHVSGWC